MQARRKARKRFMDTVETGGLRVAKALYDFMNDEALPETGLAVERFWDGLGAIVRGFAPRNRKLLDLRDTLQARIDDFRLRRPGIQGRPRPDLRGPLATERLHGMDSACAPARSESAGRN